MLKRNKQIILRLNNNEFDKLKKRVKKSGVSQVGYIRSLINGYIPVDVPPPDYHSMMVELRGIGKTMNQIAQKAHSLNVIDAKKYDEAFEELRLSLIKIVKAVSQPRKILEVDKNGDHVSLENKGELGKSCQVCKKSR